MFLKAQ